LKKKQINEKHLKILKECLYIAIFLFSIFFFLGVIQFLNYLAHPFIIAFSLLISSGIIVIYEVIKRKVNKNSRIIFSFLFILSSLIMLMVTLLFHQNSLVGVNKNPQNISLDIYIINKILTKEKALDYVNEANKIWNKYNITIQINKIYFKNVNLSKDETDYLFKKGYTEEECINYSKILSKFIENNELKIIFLDDLENGIKGRGCICNCTFVIVAPEKILFKDFTGWNLAHEIGHLLGLEDIRSCERIKKNLMNDEYKKVLWKSDYLTQDQVNKIINKVRGLRR